MVNQIDKDSIFEEFSFSGEGSSYAFVKKKKFIAMTTLALIFFQYMVRTEHF